MLDEHKNNIAEVNIIPSTGGVFEVKFGDKLLFSKKELDRFPNDNEVENMIKDNM